METLQAQVAACKQAIQAAAPRIVETQAQTALALVTLRIQNDGLTGARYTEKSVPRFFFASRAFNAGGRAYAKEKKKGTYPGFKAALGLRSDVVTLTFTGRMFRSLTTVYAGFTGTVYTAKIVASDQEEADKVGYNMDRYGDFLAPDAAEAADVAQVGQVELAKIIQQFFPAS
jgi:hypothetical protein